MKITFDSNVFFDSVVGDKTCEKLISTYFGNPNFFITPEVNKELIKVRGRWVRCVDLIRDRNKPQQSPTTTAKEIENYFGNDMFENVSNLLDYLEKKWAAGSLDIEKEHDILQSKIGSYTPYKYIFPTSEMFESEKQYGKGLKDHINQNKLAEGSGDKNILQQIGIFYQTHGENTILITSNTKDFNDSKLKWKTYLSFVDVVHPNNHKAK